jgi:hypothetical protein
MVTEPRPIEVHLPDGGHLIVTGSVDDVLDAVVHTGDTAADAERAIRDQAEDHGLRCTSSSGGGTTTLVVSER